jgi:TonB family protein
MPRRVIEEAKKLNRTGLIQILIDERGSVEAVQVRQSVTAAYDARVVAAARAWKFRPATKDGVRVKYVKTIAVTPYEQ